VIRIGSPPRGRSVTRCSGHTAKPVASWSWKRRIAVASTSVASCSANVAPMQMRGPAPNGR
jgi:hypothetical protein